MKVVVVDNQFVWREGVCALLRSNALISQINAFEEYPHSSKEIIHFQEVDVMVVGYQASLLPLLSIWVKKFKVILILDLKEKSTIDESVQLRADAYLTRDCSYEEFNEALGEVINGNTFVCPRISQKILFSQGDSEKKIELTAREKEVIQLIVAGFKSKEMADKLFVSLHTIQSHRKNIMKKLGVSSASEITRWAYESGIASAE